MSLRPEEKDQINAAIGYTAEVCEPNEQPVTAYVTDRWGQAQRSDIYEAVEAIIEAREAEARASERTAAMRLATGAMADTRVILEQQLGPCVCEPYPIGEGPVEECPQHGRPYTDWVERSDRLSRELHETHDEVLRLKAQLEQVPKVEIIEQLNRPSVCKVWIHGRLVFHGRDLTERLRKIVVREPETDAPDFSF